MLSQTGLTKSSLHVLEIKSVYLHQNFSSLKYTQT